MKQDIKFAFHLLLHPIDGFWDMKHENRGKMKAALVILTLTVASFVFERLAIGFAYDNKLGQPLDIFFEIKFVLIPLLLFVLANASITTLMDGQGRMKDIFMGACYSLTPLILIKIPLTILTNVLTLQESVYVSSLNTFSYVWVAVLLYFAIMMVHNYEPGRTLFIVFLTLVAMGIILFICVLFFSLLSEIVGFAYTIYKELTYRF